MTNPFENALEAIENLKRLTPTPEVLACINFLEKNDTSGLRDVSLHWCLFGVGFDIAAAIFSTHLSNVTTKTNDFYKLYVNQSPTKLSSRSLSRLKIWRLRDVEACLVNIKVLDENYHFIDKHGNKELIVAFIRLVFKYEKTFTAHGCNRLFLVDITEYFKKRYRITGALDTNRKNEKAVRKIRQEVPDFDRIDREQELLHNKKNR